MDHRVDDPVTARLIGEAAHRARPPTDLPERPFHGIRRADRPRVGPGSGEEGEQLVEILLQTRHRPGPLGPPPPRSPAEHLHRGPLTRGRVDRLRLCETRGVEPPRERRRHVAELVDPAALAADEGVDEVERGEEPRVPVGHDQAEGRPEEPPRVKVLQERRPRRLALGVDLAEGQQLPRPLRREPVGAQDHPLARPQGALHRAPDPVEQEVAVAVLERPGVEAVDVGPEALRHPRHGARCNSSTTGGSVTHV